MATPGSAPVPAGQQVQIHLRRVPARLLATGAGFKSAGRGNSAPRQARPAAPQTRIGAAGRRRAAISAPRSRQIDKPRGGARSPGARSLNRRGASIFSVRGPRRRRPRKCCAPTSLAFARAAGATLASSRAARPGQRAEFTRQGQTRTSGARARPAARARARTRIWWRRAAGAHLAGRRLSGAPARWAGEGARMLHNRAARRAAARRSRSLADFHTAPGSAPSGGH